MAASLRGARLRLVRASRRRIATGSAIGADRRWGAARLAPIDALRSGLMTGNAARDAGEPVRSGVAGDKSGGDGDESRRVLARRRRHLSVRLAALIGAGLVAVPLLAACGGDITGPGTPSAATSGQGGQRPRGPGRIPSVTGVIAAVQGSTLQVQANNQQTAVTFGGGTTIRAVQAAASSAVTVGSCVAVRAISTTSSGSGGFASSGSGSSASPSTATVTAGSIEISQPVNGSCTASMSPFAGSRLGGGQVGQGTGRGGGTRTSRPTDESRGGSGGGGIGRGGLTGTVLTVSGGTLTVAPVSRSRLVQSGSSAASPASPAPSPAITTGPPQTVDTTSSTTYTQLVSASAAGLTVGRCVSAFGAADATGAITATSITVRDAANGPCTGAAPRGSSSASSTAAAGA